MSRAAGGRLSGRLRALAALWRREPHLGAPAALGALGLALLPFYLGLRRFAPLLDGRQFIHDFSYYYEAAGRFRADPLTLYADPEFFYPPPSVLAFLPTQALPPGWAYLVWDLLVVVALAGVAVVLSWRLYERATGREVPDAVRVSLLLFGLASAPVYHNLHYGQVNVLVLVLALLFLTEAGRRPVLAALALCGGFWIKLYPLVLAPLALRSGRAARAAVGFTLGLVALPVALLPVVPLELHRTFWLDRLPAWGGLTNQGALNQSLVGALTRLGLPPEAPLRALDVPAPDAVRHTAAALAAVLLGGVLAAALARRLPVAAAGLVLLALLPVLSALGWEHTYVLALPLYLWLLLDARERGRGARLFAGLAALVLMVPRLPHTVLTWAVAHVPRPLLDLIIARFLPVTMAAAAVAVVWFWGRESRGVDE